MSDTCCLCHKKLSFFESGLKINVTGKIYCDNCSVHFAQKVRMMLARNTVAEIKEQYEEAIELINKDPSLTPYNKNLVCNDVTEARDQLLNEAKKIDETQNQALALYNQHIEQQQELTERFSTARVFANVLFIDEKSKQWTIKRRDGDFALPHKYSDIIKYEVIQNGQSVQGSNSGKALAGYLLFGITGAVIGSAGAKESTEFVNDLHINIAIKDMDCPNLVIQLIDTSISKTSDQYRQAAKDCEQITSMLEYIKNDIVEENAPRQEKARAIYAFSVADEITKFRKLADDGIITEEEFQTQKRKLLALDY